MNKFLFKRELGICNERREIIDEIKRNIRHLDLSIYKQIINYNKGPINHLDIDVAENRYLLSVSGDGIIQIYDLFENLLNNKKNNEIKTEFQPILKINRSNINNNNSNNNSEGILLKGISSVQWYPIDTGIFFIGGVNGNVEVWDTNLGQVSQTFYLENCVNSISYSQVNCTNLLIAAATTDPKVRLCDMRTNSSVHCLTGHRESVLSVKWSPFSPNLIATASKDKTIRLWDIRRGDTFLFALDQYNGSGESNNGGSGGNGGDIGNDVGGGNKNDLKQSKRYRQKLHKPKSLQSSHSSIIEKRNIGGSGGYSGVSANLALKKEVPTAHNGTITSITWAPDGNYLVSTGADSKIRLWDIQKGGANTMINFPNAHNVHKIPNQICLSTNGQYLFHPNGRAIHVYETSTGNLVRQLKGHFEKVNCCVFNHCDQALVSGSNDRLTLYWDNSNDDQIDDQQFLNDEKQQNQNLSEFQNNNYNNNQVTTSTTKTSTTISPPTTLEDVDNWSDDE
ncbi:hypothetical protein ACTFIU_002017 [Dictyostelium citrinum]